MTKAVTAVNINTPSSDPNIDVGQTFGMQANIVWGGAGHGGDEDVDLYWEYSTTSGSGFGSIPTSGSELTASLSSPQTESSSPSQSLTITGEAEDTYYVRFRVVGVDSAETFNSGEQEITVNAAAIVNYKPQPRWFM